MSGRGYIAEGTAHFQIKDGPVETLNTGDAFFEPANTIIDRFDNALPHQSLKFIAYYLPSNDEEQLIGF